MPWAFDALQVKAVEGSLSFQMQFTIDRSTDFNCLTVFDFVATRVQQLVIYARVIKQIHLDSMAL